MGSTAPDPVADLPDPSGRGDDRGERHRRHGHVRGIMLLPPTCRSCGASPTESGLLMLPMVVGMMTSSIGSGQIISPHRSCPDVPDPRVGPHGRRPGAAVPCAVPTRRWSGVSGAMFVLGIGLGNCMQPLLLIVQSGSAHRDRRRDELATFFRQIGGTLGVAIFPSVLFSSVGGNIADAIRVDADRAVAADRHRSAGARQPGDKAVITELAILARRWRHSPRCRTTPRSSTRCTRCSPTRSGGLRDVDGPGVPARGRGGRARVPDPAPAAR